MQARSIFRRSPTALSMMHCTAYVLYVNFLVLILAYFHFYNFYNFYNILVVPSALLIMFVTVSVFHF